MGDLERLVLDARARRPHKGLKFITMPLNNEVDTVGLLFPYTRKKDLAQDSYYFEAMFPSSIRNTQRTSTNFICD